MKWFEPELVKELETRRGVRYRAVLPDRALTLRFSWNVLKDRVDLDLADVNAGVIAEGVPLLLNRNLLASAQRAKGWQLVASRADKKHTYARDEINRLRLRLGIPETTEEINDAPLLAVT